VFGLFGFCWSPESGTGPETGATGPVVAMPKFAACGSPPPHGDIAPFVLCSVLSFFGSVTEKKVRHRSEPWRDMWSPSERRLSRLADFLANFPIEYRALAQRKVSSNHP
jgi:hypothetical protein